MIMTHIYLFKRDENSTNNKKYNHKIFTYRLRGTVPAVCSATTAPHRCIQEQRSHGFPSWTTPSLRRIPVSKKYYITISLTGAMAFSTGYPRLNRQNLNYELNTYN